MTARTVAILGLNGHIGHFAARAFAEAGWHVTGFGRADRRPVPGVRFIEGDADDPAALEGAVAEAEVVVNALNLPYHKWGEGRAEAQLERVIEAVAGGGRTLMFPANVYNYAATDRVIAPDTPQRPQTPRGAIRVRMENRLRAAAEAGALRAILVRAGDFYGPEAGQDFFDQLILREAGKGKVALAAGEVPHAWAYLPDLARVFVALAARREGFGAFESFHFAGHFVTPGRMFDAIAAAADRPLRRVPTQWGMLRLVGLVMPVIREVVKMRYLWEHPMELRDPRLDAMLGADFGTPFEAAVAETAAPFFAEAKAAA